MPNQPIAPLTDLTQAFQNGHISESTFTALAAAYRTEQPTAGERGVAVSGSLSEGTVVTGNHNRHTQVGTYIEHQTVMQGAVSNQSEAVQKLLEEITSQTMRFMMSIQFVQVQPTRERFEAMNAAYHVWEVENAKIETKLRAGAEARSDRSLVHLCPIRDPLLRASRHFCRAADQQPAGHPQQDRPASSRPAGP